jgi:hypothetical protein
MKRIVRLVAVIMGSVLDPDRVLFQKPLATPWQKLKDNKTPVIPDLILDSPTKYPRSQHGKSMSQFASLPAKRRNLLQTLNFTATTFSAIVLTFTLLSPSLTSLPTQAQSTQPGPGNSFPTDKETMEKDIILNPRPDNIVDEKSRLNQNDYSGRSTTEFFLGIDNQGNEQPTPRDDGTECDAFYFKYYPFKDSNPEYYTDPIYQTQNNPTGEIQNPYVALGIPTCPSLTECTTISHQPIKNRRVGTCNDGLYTIRSQETDTAGNTGEWVEQSIERDTVKPFAPEVTIGATGDIFGQHLSLSISGEAHTTATIRIHHSNGYKKDFEIFIGDDGTYSSNKFLSLVCGDVLYEVQVRLTDRAGNLGYWADIEELRTLECPRCTSSGNGLFSSPIGDNPVPYLSSDFPIRKIPGNYFGSHAGLDFAGPLGTPIYAAQSGVVTRVTMGYDNNGYLNHPAGWANTIIIRHNLENQPEIYTIYAHLDNKQLVNEGDEVAQGQLIGYMGDSGSSSGPHLHFQLEVQGSSLNPIHEGKYHKYPPQNPRDYLGDIEGNLTENQEQQHCVHDGFGDTDFAGYPETTMEEARPKIIQYLEDNFESDTIIENHTYNWAESIQQLKDGHGEGWKGQIIIHQWCTHVWVLDLQYLHQKSGFGDGGDGYDGQIIFNPYTKQPTLIKNGIWDKYQASGGPCGVVGVPSGLEGEGGAPGGSQIIPGKTWWQGFEKGLHRHNRIFAFNTYYPCALNPFPGCIETYYHSYYVVDNVANHFNSRGDINEFGYPKEDTEIAPQYCAQKFQFTNISNRCSTLFGGEYLSEFTVKNTNQSNWQVKTQFIGQGVDPNERTVGLKIVSDNKDIKSSYDGESQVWIVSHGWYNNPQNDLCWDYNYMEVLNSDGAEGQCADTAYSPTERIKEAHPNDIVLALDWRQASGYGSGLPTQVNNAALWIVPTAEEVAKELRDWGLDDGRKLNFVGHSLGSLMSREIADQFGQGNFLVALDPASQLSPSGENLLHSYDLNGNNGNNSSDSDSALNKDSEGYFKNKFKFSRSFVGNKSVAGSKPLSRTAHESILVNYNHTLDVGKEHFFVIQTFDHIVSNRKFKDGLVDLKNISNNEFISDTNGHQATVTASKDNSVNYDIRFTRAQSNSQRIDYIYGTSGGGDQIEDFVISNKDYLVYGNGIKTSYHIPGNSVNSNSRIMNFSKGEDTPDYSSTSDRIKITEPNPNVIDYDIKNQNGVPVIYYKSLFIQNPDGSPKVYRQTAVNGLSYEELKVDYERFQDPFQQSDYFIK